jgi:hypothetical protein
MSDERMVSEELIEKICKEAGVVCHGIRLEGEARKSSVRITGPWVEI